MLKEERQQHILQTLRREGKILASELSAALGISEDTIRRDLRELDDAGLLQRVHGGALPRPTAVGSYRARQQQAPAAKASIAQAATGLFRDGQVIMMDGGTTTLQVATHLPPTLRATVITNSPPIAVALAEHPGVTVEVIGGRLYKDSLVAVGAAAVEALRMIRADLCLLGVCSLHPEIGISVPNLEEVYVKRAMIANAAEVVALADAEKLGTATAFVVAPIHELTHLVTERSVPAEALAPYRAHNITVIQG
jgi:DeoR/GlpR family transcriptional regulator of sugar metabolism